MDRRGRPGRCGSVEQHHVSHHGFLQRLVRRLRHTCGASLRRQGFCQDAVVCEQRHAHRRGAGRGHHPAQLRLLLQDPAPRQHARRHLRRRMDVSLPAIPGHPFHHSLQPSGQSHTRLGRQQAPILFPHLLVAVQHCARRSAHLRPRHGSAGRWCGHTAGTGFLVGAMLWLHPQEDDRAHSAGRRARLRQQAHIHPAQQRGAHGPAILHHGRRRHHVAERQQRPWHPLRGVVHRRRAHQVSLHLRV